MKRIHFPRIVFFVALFAILAGNAAKAQRIEIHHIGVGDGDAILLIAIDETQTGYMDTVTALIDGNRSSKPGAAIWEYVNDVLTKLAPNRKKLDFVILSHLHIDHYGGLITVIDKIQKAGWDIGIVIDRDGAGNKPSLSWNLDSNYIHECVDEDISFPSYTSTAQRYVTLTSVYNKSTIAPGFDIFEGKNFKHMSMVCLAAMGAALNTSLDGYDMFLPYNSGKGEYVPYNENDLSFVFNIGFGGFNFFMGGDIGGGKPYADGETPIANYLKARFTGSGDFHYCGIKVSHHGSAHSTNANFLAGTTPTMGVIQANLRTYGGTALPTETTVRALRTSLPSTSNLKFCFVPTDPGTLSDYWTKGKLAYYQDVVVKVNALTQPGQDIPMEVITQKRKKETLALTGAPVSTTITCTKSHFYSFK